MKVVLFLSALAVFGGLLARTSYAQYHPPTTKPAARHVGASPVFRPGSIGGPANKPNGVGGSANKPGGINGTGKPPKH
jgi:hypothetical protein